MANFFRNDGIFLPRANPDLTNDTPLYAGGELGQLSTWNNRLYRRVKLDSGATAATPAGAVAANQLAFWKDKTNAIVTNNSVAAQGGLVANAWRNFVAGVFRTAVTPGNYCDILVWGLNIPVKITGAGSIGQIAQADDGATTASIESVAVGTAPGYQSLGVIVASDSGGNVNVDVAIPNTPSVF